jgi:C4-dicarboxylate-specific signal transduction histidine kinase
MKKLEHAAKFGEMSQGLLHDLMSPLSSISLYIEHLKDAKDATSMDSDSLLRMIDVSKRLNSFSKNLKQYLGKENGVERSEFTDVVKELEIMRDILSFRARMAGVRLEFHMPQSLILPVDHIRMHQVISNLMTNALEACEARTSNTEEDALISVTLTHDTHSIRLSVSDTGCGIAPENIPRAFKEPFTTKNWGLALDSWLYGLSLKENLAGLLS